MAKQISVEDLMAQATAAVESYNAAVEQRKNIRKVVRTLADAGLLSASDAKKVEEIFPKRERKGGEETAAAE